MSSLIFRGGFPEVGLSEAILSTSNQGVKENDPVLVGHDTEPLKNSDIADRTSSGGIRQNLESNII